MAGGAPTHDGRKPVATTQHVDYIVNALYTVTDEKIPSDHAVS